MCASLGVVMRTRVERETLDHSVAVDDVYTVELIRMYLEAVA